MKQRCLVVRTFSSSQVQTFGVYKLDQEDSSKNSIGFTTVSRSTFPCTTHNCVRQNFRFF